MTSRYVLHPRTPFKNYCVLGGGRVGVQRVLTFSWGTWQSFGDEWWWCPTMRMYSMSPRCTLTPAKMVNLCHVYFTTTKKFTINKLTCLCNHNVVIVPVTDSKNKGCHTIASTGINKSLHCCLKLIKKCLNISCVLTTKSGMNLLQMTFKKTLHFQRAS